MPSETVRPRASRVPQALRTPAGAPEGVWLGASYALAEPVLVTEPYPHVCRRKVLGVMTRRLVRITRTACAACAEQAAPARQPDPAAPQRAGSDRED